MAGVQNKPDIDVHRFAVMLAGFDICNSSDEEAAIKGLELRRIAKKAGMRIVDLLEVPEVRAAVDAHLSPKRQKDPVLQEALELTSALQEELTERTRDVRLLAEELKRQEERTEDLSRELAVARRSPVTAPTTGAWSPSVFLSPAPAGQAAIRLPGIEPGTAILTALLALTLLIAAIFGGHFQEAGGNGNGMGNGQRVSASRVHEGRAVRSLPEHGAVRHRLRRGGASAGTR